jgi:pyruvate, water dikinase
MPDRPTSPYTLWFDDYTEADRGRVGGKNASLGTMLQAGLPVPPGFAVTTEAYATLREQPGLREAVQGRLAPVNGDAAELQRASAEVRAMLEAVPLPAEVERGIRDGYAALSAWCGVDDVPVAVRSSATAEDLPDASFAGQQDTFLWVRGVESVLDAVQRCWSSVFTDRAIAYRRQTGHDHERIDMSVGIQKMVEPKVAGVAFTLCPLDGDRSQIAIDASWGLGEAVVSGEVTPDSFLVDKVLFEIVSRRINDKAIEYRVSGDGVEVVEVDAERRSTCCMSDEEIKSVARLARRAEKHYGCPQDVEWAIDEHLPEGEQVVLLQSRPETVWSKRPRRVVEQVGDPMQAIVSTLLSPMHAREKAAKGS